MSQFLLSAQNISFSAQTKKILQDVSLDLQIGELLAIVGPNGAGKTTLLKILAGLLKINSGNLQNLVGKTNLAYLAQHETLPPDFTARELVALGRLAHQAWMTNPWRSESNTDKNAIEAAMQATDTTQFANRNLATLSGGEIQRVALARALAQQPKLLLLDEPTNHLDISHQSELLRVLRQQRDLGLTSAMVLHDLNLAALCDRVILLYEGKILCEGKPEKVLQQHILEKAYGMHLEVLHDQTGRPVVIPT